MKRGLLVCLALVLAACQGPAYQIDRATPFSAQAGDRAVFMRGPMPPVSELDKDGQQARRADLMSRYFIRQALGAKQIQVADSPSAGGEWVIQYNLKQVPKQEQGEQQALYQSGFSLDAREADWQQARAQQSFSPSAVWQLDLHISVRDAQSGDVLWFGSALGIASNDGFERINQRQLRKAVNTLMQAFLRN